MLSTPPPGKVDILVIFGVFFEKVRSGFIFFTEKSLNFMTNQKHFRVAMTSMYILVKI